MPKRIGIFMDQLVLGSSPKIAGEEVNHLKRLGVDAELLLIRRGMPPQCRDFLTTVRVRCLEDYLPKVFRTNFKFPGFSFFSFFHMTCPIYAPLTLKREYDVLIVHFTYTCFTAYMLKKIRNIPYIAFIHDPITHILRKVYSHSFPSLLLPILTTLGTNMDKFISNSAEIIILPSKYHLNLMKELTETPIKVVYHGVEPIEKIPKERGDYFISVARWEQGKKPFFLLDVLDKLKNKDHQVMLLMVGPWTTQSLQTRFLKEAKKRNLLDQIKLCGQVKEKELTRLYLNSRALVHPVSEAFGMIGLEAAAKGAPVIIPKQSGVTELFVHGIHGFFPEEGDADEYAEYISRLAFNERLAWKMGYEAWKISKQYTWEKHAEKLLEVINDVF